MKYAVSIVVAQGLPCTTILHDITMIDAVSFHEALGKGMLVAHRLYPADAGWVRHHVAAKSVDDPAVAWESVTLQGRRA